jgi:hypothetical protein
MGQAPLLHNRKESKLISYGKITIKRILRYSVWQFLFGAGRDYQKRMQDFPHRRYNRRG